MVHQQAVEQQPEPHAGRQRRFGGFEEERDVRGDGGELVLEEEDEEDYGCDEAVDGKCAVGS